MNEMAILDSIAITAQNLTNGNLGAYQVTIDSAVALADGDRLLFTVPDVMSLGNSTSCAPGPGVEACSSEHSGRSVIVSLDTITETLGSFTVYIDGIVNPPSLKQSSFFTAISMRDKDQFPIQKVTDYETLFVQTDTVAIIQNYQQVSTSEQYGEDTEISLNFQAVNRIPLQGYIELTWPETVVVYEDTTCSVTTSKPVTKPGLCVFDFETSTLAIDGAFDSVYEGSVTVTLSRVRNPLSNKVMVPFTISTYDDVSKQFPIDTLNFVSLMECFYTCRFCGTQKDYCTECWPGDENIFLQRLGFTSQC